VHQVHHQDRNVAQARAAVPQVAEGFVAWGVDHQHARQLQVHFDGLVQLVGLLLQGGPREKGSADLLGDAPSFAVLHAGAPNFVQELLSTKRAKIRNDFFNSKMARENFENNNS